jgi:hypothetical protein
MGSSLAQVQAPQSSSSGKGIGRSDGLDQNAIDADPAGFANWQQQKNMQPQTSSGKGGGLQGSQGAVTFPGQGAQPQMGMPNAYSNTINPQPVQQSSWDNSNNPSGKGSAGSAGSSGKGKGA